LGANEGHKQLRTQSHRNREFERVKENMLSKQWIWWLRCERLESDFKKCCRYFKKGSHESPCLTSMRAHPRCPPRRRLFDVGVRGVRGIRVGAALRPRNRGSARIWPISPFPLVSINIMYAVHFFNGRKDSAAFLHQNVVSGRSPRRLSTKPIPRNSFVLLSI